MKTAGPLPGDEIRNAGTLFTGRVREMVGWACGALWRVRDDTGAEVLVRPSEEPRVWIYCGGAPAR